jgi:cytosine/adenosine deaminase-related metal-dependent hydrolase
MLLEVRNAMLLSRLREPKFWLNTEDVLWMATVGGAKALGRDDIGQIMVGKCADINLIDMDKLEYSGGLHDPAAAIVFNVAMSPIDHVIVNGKQVVENGEIAGLDVKDLVKRHQRTSADLIAVAEKKMPQRLRR